MSSRCDSREKTKGGGTRGSATTCSLTVQPSRNANTRCVYNRLVVPPRFQRFELPERKASKRFLASKWRDRKRDRERVSTSLFEKEILRAESSATTIPAIENFAFVAIVTRLYSIPGISRRLIIFDPIAVLSIEFFAEEDEGEENAEEKKFLGNWKFDDGRKVFVSAGNESNLDSFVIRMEKKKEKEKERSRARARGFFFSDFDPV